MQPNRSHCRFTHYDNRYSLWTPVLGNGNIALTNFTVWIKIWDRYCVFLWRTNNLKANLFMLLGRTRWQLHTKLPLVIEQQRNRYSTIALFPAWINGRRWLQKSPPDVATLTTSENEKKHALCNDAHLLLWMDKWNKHSIFNRSVGLLYTMRSSSTILHGPATLQTWAVGKCFDLKRQDNI